jgi:hypothetical protein
MATLFLAAVVYAALASGDSTVAPRLLSCETARRVDAISLGIPSTLERYAAEDRTNPDRELLHAAAAAAWNPRFAVPAVRLLLTQLEKASGIGWEAEASDVISNARLLRLLVAMDNGHLAFVNGGCTSSATANLLLQAILPRVRDDKIHLAEERHSPEVLDPELRKGGILALFLDLNSLCAEKVASASRLGSLVNFAELFLAANSTDRALLHSLTILHCKNNRGISINEGRHFSEALVDSSIIYNEPSNSSFARRAALIAWVNAIKLEDANLRLTGDSSLLALSLDQFDHDSRNLLMGATVDWEGLWAKLHM